MLGLFGEGRFEVLGETTGEGTTVTAANGSKGSPATLGTSAFDYSGFYLGLASANNVAFRVDVVVGASNDVIFPDLGFDTRTVGANTQPAQIYVPLAIPSGTAVKVAAQSSGAFTLRALVTGYNGDGYMAPITGGIINLNGWSGVDPVNTATQSGTAGVNTAWVELTSSLARDIAGLYLGFNGVGTATRGAGRLLVDIGVGSAGSEVVLLTVPANNANSNFGDIVGPIMRSIPAGTRVAWRVRGSSTMANPFGVVAHGLVR